MVQRGSFLNSFLAPQLGNPPRRFFLGRFGKRLCKGKTVLPEIITRTIFSAELISQRDVYYTLWCDLAAAGSSGSSCHQGQDQKREQEQEEE